MKLLPTRYKEYSGAGIRTLTGREHYRFLVDQLRSASSKLYSTMFVLEPTPRRDDQLLVYELLRLLAHRSRQGVDIRILLTPSKTFEIFQANYTAFNWLRYRKVGVRWFSRSTDSMHSKVVLIDERVSLIGSSNWSPGGFDQHDETTVAVISQPINRALTKRFLANWKKAKTSL
jgi:phosphatidylserine/phosphatidylglycerophosphate/cardiolipin synthase-like enzyme